MTALSRVARRLGALAFAAFICCAAPAGAEGMAAAPDPMRFSSAMQAAIREAMTGDPTRAIGFYREALAEVDKGLPIDRATGSRLGAGLLREFERAGRPGDAIAFLETIATDHPALNGPWPAYLCRLYLKRHALDKAEPSCLGAIDEEARQSATVPPAQTVLLGRVLAIRQSLLEISAAVQDSSSAAFRQADATGNTAFSKPEESFLRTLSPYSLLAQVYFERADAAALGALHDGRFARYAARIDERLEGAVPATGYQPLEDDHARFGAVFAGLNMAAPAEQAMLASLRLNAVRTRFIATQYNPSLLAGTLATRRAKAALYASMVMRRPASGQASLASMAGELLQSKGVLTELLALRHRIIERDGDRYLVQLYHQAERAAASGDEAAWKAAVLQLDALNPAWLPGRLFDEGGDFVARLRARLGTRTLVSVIRYAPFDFKGQSFGAPHYLALRLRDGEVTARDIGAADELDLMVQRYRAEAAAAQDAAASPRVRSLARGLYTKVLAPVLGERLADGDYVADLDGMLNLLPLEALVDASGRYLVEAAAWRYVSSARALLREPEAPAAAPDAPSTALVLADPAFSATLPATDEADPGKQTLRAVPAAAAALGRFQPLPETGEEGRAVGLAVERIGARATVLSGAGARTAALAAARAPRFLHIATHGFFLEDQPPAAPGMMSSEALSGGMAGGIALAGANPDGAQGYGEGLFFISQFRTLDLNGTELVVMSACDTGVGTVRAGEGLNSLRQSLELAGARAQVTALWKVPSAATTRLMVRFYDRLAGGVPKAQALRQAKLDVMKTWPNPLYWAGFTFAGEE